MAVEFSLGELWAMQCASWTAEESCTVGKISGTVIVEQSEGRKIPAKFNRGSGLRRKVPW